MTFPLKLIAMFPRVAPAGKRQAIVSFQKPEGGGGGVRGGGGERGARGGRVEREGGRTGIIF